MSPRPHPHLAIPLGAAPPAPPSPRFADNLRVLVTPPNSVSNPWDNEHQQYSTFTPGSPNTAYPHIAFPEPHVSRPASRASSAHEATSPRSYEYPEAQSYKSPTARAAALRPSASFQNLGHRSTRSESTLSARPSLNRGESRPSSYMSTESSPEVWHCLLTSSLGQLAKPRFSSSVL